MSKMARPQKALKKKKWVQIVAPRELDNINLGETPSFNPPDIKGRTIWVNLMQITNDPRKQNISLKLKMKEVKEDKVDTETVGYEISSSYIKRIVRVGRNKVEDSFLCTTKDNVKIRIKPILITIHNTKNSVISSLRREARKRLEKTVSEYDFHELISAVLGGRIQKELRVSLTKIYPLSVCDFKVLERA